LVLNSSLFSSSGRLLFEQTSLFGFLRSLLRNEQELLQIATSVLIEFDSFLLEHALLLIVWQHHSPRGTLALRIQHTMPGRAVRRTVHDETNCPRRVAFAEQLGDLAVSHYST